MAKADAHWKDTSVPAPLTLELSESAGRVTLHMTVQRLGADYSVSLFGGDAHVGAVALALPHEPCAGHGHGAAQEASSPQANAMDVSVLTVPGHREDELARQVAQVLSAALHSRVSVVCGIHYDHISREEIALVLALADRLTHRALQDLGPTAVPPPSAPGDR